jgi:hypothetical protein
MLPGRSRLAEQFDAGAAQFLDGRRKVTDREPDDRPGIKVLPAPVERAEDLNVPAIGAKTRRPGSACTGLSPSTCS